MIPQLLPIYRNLRYRLLLSDQNLITNGTFSENIIGWGSSTAGVLSWEAGVLRVTREATDTAGAAYQQLTLTVGVEYSYQIEIIGMSANCTYRVGFGSTNAATDYVQHTGSTATVITGTYTPSVTQPFLVLIASSSDVTLSGYVDFDNIIVTFA